MADAPRGAAAPIPAAVRAAHPTTTTPQAAADLLAGRVLHRVNRLLALSDMARAQPLGDPDLPTGDDSTDSADRLAALLHCLNVELCELHTMVSPEGRDDAGAPSAQAEPAPIAAPAAMLKAATVAASLTQRAGELACLVAMAADLATRGADTGDIGTVWGLRSLLGAMRPQADALHDLAARSEGGAA